MKTLIRPAPLLAPFITLMAALGATSFSATATLTGVVKELRTAKPVANAVVRLAGKGLADTTDLNGNFSFSFPLSTVRKTVPGWIRPHYAPGRGIVFSNRSRGPVRVEVLDLAGKAVATLGNSVLEAGIWSLPIRSLSKGQYLGEIISGNGTQAFRFVTIENGIQTGGAARPEGFRGPEAFSGITAAKSSAEVIDTLITTKGGYHADTLAWNEKITDSVTVFLRDTNTSQQGPMVRTIMPFDADWLFYKGDAAGADKPAFADAGWRTVTVPHDWSIEGPFAENAPTGGYGGYLPSGIGWYRKHFTLPGDFSGRRIFVEFDGVMANSTVYLNGAPLGTRPSGYISFRHEITAQAKFGGAENIIAVKADNSAQPASRWYSGAGIYRHVRILAVNPVHLEKWATFVTTPTVSTVHVQTTVVNQGTAAQTVAVQTVLIDPDGSRSPPVTSAAQSIPAAGSASFAIDVPVSAARLWSLETPNLYRAITTVQSGSAGLDDEVTQFGIRTIKYDPETGFFLNGKSVKQKGVCLHQEFSGLGVAVPQRAMQRRLAILKSLGVNAIRTSHNPVAPEFLDLCDRMGILVMDEFFDVWVGHKYGMPGDYAAYFNQTNPATGTKWYQSDLNDGVQRDRNHPSIVYYSIGNEIRDGINTRIPLTKDMVAICHANDPTRPVTQALFQPSTAGDYPGGTLNILDVFGVNYRTAELLDAITQNAPHHAGVSTEQGPNPGNWSAFYLKNPQVVGVYLWTGADYLGETPLGWPTVGSGSGLIDRVGGIKDMGYQYQAIWSDKTGARPKTSNGPAVKVLLSVDHPAVAADGDDVAYVKASLVDAGGSTVANAGNAVTFQMAGSAGEFKAFDSGSNSSESFTGPSRNAWNGVCYAIVHMKAAGSVTVTASAANLAGSSVTVTGVNSAFIPCSGNCD